MLFFYDQIIFPAWADQQHEAHSSICSAVVLQMYYAMQISSNARFAEVSAMIMSDLNHLVELICFMHYDQNHQHILCCDPGVVFLANRNEICLIPGGKVCWIHI